MLKIPVLACDINHLTDARYFAAWGVDYMAFVVDQDDPRTLLPEQLKEIVDWVEGPVMLGQWQGLAPIRSDYVEILSGLIFSLFVPEHLREELSDADPKFIEVHSDIALVASYVDDGYHVILKSEESYSTLSSRLQEHHIEIAQCLIDTTGTLDLGDAPSYGIVLRGSEEEKVGYKSYDDLDEILEGLMAD